MQPSSDPDRQRPTLTPPERVKVRKKDNRLAVLLIMVGLFVLLGTAAMVIWLLPHSGTQKNTAANQSTPPPATLINEPTPDKTDQAAVKAEQLLGEWLRLQARAEAGMAEAASESRGGKYWILGIGKVSGHSYRSGQGRPEVSGATIWRVSGSLSK
jgi:hypothetical protein